MVPENGNRKSFEFSVTIFRISKVSVRFSGSVYITSIVLTVTFCNGQCGGGFPNGS